MIHKELPRRKFATLRAIPAVLLGLALLIPSCASKEDVEERLRLQAEQMADTIRADTIPLVPYFDSLGGIPDTVAAIGDR